LNPNFSVHPNNFSSFTLFGLSLGNYVLMYWANIFLARRLDMDAFDDYSVAISVVTLLSSLATLGLEKYALRLLALNIEREMWARLRAFCHFAIKAIVLFSLGLMAITVLGLATLLEPPHAAILLYPSFLPVIALCLFLVEVITVYGHQILALALYRFFAPALFLILLFALNDFRLEISAVSAVICFGAAWCATLLLMGISVKAIAPHVSNANGASQKDKRKWLKKSLSLLLSSLMMTLLTSAGTIILEILYPSEAVVGIYAVAIQTSALISLIGTSTNRYYLPMLVVLLERRDQAGIRRLLNKRMRLITGFVAVFLGVIGWWGQDILGLFGDEFTAGYPVLFVCAAGSVFMTLFSDSLYYLQFMGQNRQVIGLMSLAALSMLILSVLLGARHGAFGVATAYALPTLLLFSALKWCAARHMRRYLNINAPT